MPSVLLDEQPRWFFEVGARRENAGCQSLFKHLISAAQIGRFHPGDDVYVRIAQSREDLLRLATSLVEQAGAPATPRSSRANPVVDSAVAVRHATRFRETVLASTDDVTWELLQMTFRFDDAKRPWHRVWLTL